MNLTYLSNEIIIDLLKKSNINHIVLSSGTRNIPFVNSVENDDFFTCYSVIDERNAAFFALGLAQEFNRPVALACTSGTAASNYLSGITEAYYSHIPLLAITFDRSPYTLEQLETQKISQSHIFSNACKKEFTLPVIKDEDDIWYCNRLVNEAIICLKQHNQGPVHINVPLTGDTNALIEASSKKTKCATQRYIDYYANEDSFDYLVSKLNKCSKLLLIIGQTTYVSEKLHQVLDDFLEKTGAALLVDNLANYKYINQISSEAVIKALNSKTIVNLLPEIVITFGCNFQERIKDLLKAHSSEFEHWSIDPDGIIRDVFKSQTVLIESKPESFFEHILNHLRVHNKSINYRNNWKTIEKSIVLPEMPWSNFYIIKELSNFLPNNSILHLSILNNTRLMQFFNLDSSIKVYSNVNCFGIDGCLPTFMGQAFATDKPAYLVIGDLSFFYAMNALSIKHRKNNIRILLINNGGGAEFHIQPVSNNLPTIDKHIGAAHNRSAKGWAESQNYKYLTAKDKKSFNEALEIFIKPETNQPILLEAFTNMKTDGEFCLTVYRESEKCIKAALEGIK